MEAAFGPGNWHDLRMSAGATPFLADSHYNFIFLEGGDSTANELNAFLAANRAAVEAFVNRGGKLLLNSAPNEGGDIDFGFGGVTLSNNSYSPDVSAADITHPVFAGLPTSFSGTYFGHAIVGPTSSIIVAPVGTVLGEKRSGNGCVLFGGMTTTNFHSPQPAAFNLRVSILNYTANGCPGLQAPKTFAENIAAAQNLINQLGPQQVASPAHRTLMNLLLGNVLRYRNSHPSLALSLLNAALLRTDGCALRQSPDTIFSQGGAGMDFVTTCAAQGPIYSYLKDAAATDPAGMN